MATWPVAWAHGLFAGGELSTPGIAVAAALTVGYFLLNAFGVRWYLRANGVLTVFKLVVPLLTGAALLVAARHPANLAAGVAPGAPPLRLPSILGAAATSGIIFSLSGFQTPINLAGEARDPGRTLPIGVFGSLAIAVVIYLVLQVAFLLATPAGMVAKGWGGVTFSSPFAELATKVGLPWLAVLLYIDAVASPTGTGATYTATTARIVIAGQRSGTLPGVLGQERGSARVPRPAVWLDLLVGFGFLLCFRGWSALAAVISVACILSFVAGPIAVTTLRRTAPDVERPFRLPAVRLVAGAAFVCATLLLYWARWPTTGEVLLLVAGAAPVWLWAERRAGWRETRRHLCAAAWLLAYMPAMALLSFLGSREFGGRDLVPFGPDLVLVALTGAVFFLWGTRSGYRTAALAERNGERRARPDAVRA